MKEKGIPEGIPFILIIVDRIILPTRNSVYIDGFAVVAPTTITSGTKTARSISVVVTTTFTVVPYAPCVE